MNIIQIISNGQRSINTIKLNKQVDSWLGVKQPLVVNRPPTGEQMTPKPSGQSTPNAGGQMTPQEIKKESNKETSKERDEADESIPYQKIVNLFHELCPSYSKIRTLSGERKKHTGARYRQYGNDLSIFEELFHKAEDSDFLKGKNDRNWKADFDWMMNETNMAKILEDKYANKDTRTAAQIARDKMI